MGTVHCSIGAYVHVHYNAAGISSSIRNFEELYFFLLAGVPCPAITITESNATNVGGVYEDIVEVVCNEGMMISIGVSAMIIQCQVDGQWNTSVTACERKYIKAFYKVTRSDHVKAVIIVLL